MSDTPGSDNLTAVSSQFRTAAGLGERESDEPETDVVNDEDGPTVEERENEERTEDDQAVDVDAEDEDPLLDDEQ